MITQGVCGATLFMAWIAAAGSACADIFVYTDNDGVVALSNVPTDTRYTLVLRTPKEDTPSVQAATGKISPNIGSRPYANIVDEAARANMLDAALLHAVIAAESDYNTRAVSARGASGLMQLMPETAERYGVLNRYDPAENVHGGAHYLHDLLQLFNNDLRLTLAAYNAGETTVARFGNKVPPYRETIDYVDKVMKLYGRYRSAGR